MKIRVTIIYGGRYKEASDHIRVFMYIGYSSCTPACKGVTIINFSTPIAAFLIYQTHGRMYVDEDMGDCYIRSWI